MASRMLGANCEIVGLGANDMLELLITEFI